MTAFVPPDFTVPLSLDGDGFRLEPLGPEHNDRDHAAWMSSIDHIRSTPGFDDPEPDWPVVMSLEQNLEDLEMHARHFAERVGFTYSVLDDDEIIGCVYIYPARQPGFDAEVRSWVTERRSELDVAVWRAVSAWLETEWPFDRPFYAPRG
jgi:hypothetical protein